MLNPTEKNPEVPSPDKMNQKSIFLGNARLHPGVASVEGKFVDFENEKFYKISNCNRMADFFLTVVSDSDHWLFLSSSGAISAGRKDRDNALFPYCTSDKIIDSKGITGSQTCLMVSKDGKVFYWEPFTEESEKLYSVERNLYKSIYGNKIIFEEINADLGIGFRYGWHTSEQFGFVRKSILTNYTSSPVTVEVLDGIRNILPNGVNYNFQNNFSNLLDAYKKNERVEGTTLGLFLLSSIPVDRAEPSESLKATTVWSAVPEPGVKVLISERQVKNFIQGLSVTQETDVRGSRGAYYINATIELPGNQSKRWTIVAEINQETGDVINLANAVSNTEALSLRVEADIVKGTASLKRLVSGADGMQMGNDLLSCARHFSNTLFNIMRGGVFISGYSTDKADLIRFLKEKNQIVFKDHHSWLDRVPDKISRSGLLALAGETGNPDLARICLEYLPLTFSRRHGDPSRPWNLFSIETRNADGSVKLNYQGNWRDIFQNWEALSLSFPYFLDGMICKFLNASTADGYNPYRITREGIDWECPDPHDPWSNIGYWGDHQVIYLLKFLELSHDFHPGSLDQLLQKEIFTYANVPYRIKNYDELVRNPKDTIVFDHDLNEKIQASMRSTGADGALLKNRNDEIYRVSLAEKILVTLLSKLSNFIPEAGIWLNTQRPEWNDANNALVGNGASVVTLCYLRRFLKFWTDRFSESAIAELHISEEVFTLFNTVFSLLTSNRALLESGFSDEDRLRFAKELGTAGSIYRDNVYMHSFSGRQRAVRVGTLSDFTRLAMDYIDQSIRVNRRSDGLYHAYNLISFTDGGVSIRHLYEMLEGQVAVLSSGCLSAAESSEVLQSLRKSKLYRTDLGSYLLYPDRQLPRFTVKNNIPAGMAAASVLFGKLTENGDRTVVHSDDAGGLHFNGTIRNSAILEEALKCLDPRKYGTLPEQEKELILRIYEEMFDHKSFTGRSGTFFGYEGLGSVYWHMVSKLLLASQECWFRGEREGMDTVLSATLKTQYCEIKAGIGLTKSPGVYGAIPTDAYSHTPGYSGAQQPGMTGQVKEDFITRIREIGIHVSQGRIEFRVGLFNTAECLDSGSPFGYYDVNGKEQHIILGRGSFGFTFCQVPFIYGSWQKDGIILTLASGRKISVEGRFIDREMSSKIFGRTGEIIRVDVSFQTPERQPVINNS